MPNSHTLKVGTGASPEPGVQPDAEEDFGGFADTADLLASVSQSGDPDWDEVEYSAGGEGTATGGVALDTGESEPAFGSDRTMRYDYDHGADECTSITNRVRWVPSAVFPTKEVWLEFRIRWSSDFSTGISGQPCGANDHKLIFIDTEAPLNGRWAFYAGADTPPTHSFQVEMPSDNDIGNVGAYYFNLPGGAADIAPGPSAFDDPTASFPNQQAWDGEWHVVRIHVKNSTTGSSGDGAFRVWYDGTLVHEETGFNITGDDRVTGTSFSHNKDDGPGDRPMEIWWSRIRAWTQDPGWAA